MRGHIIESGVRIAPVLDPVGETPVGNRSLRTWQEESLSRCGVEVAAPGERPRGPCLVLPDNLFVSWPLARAFVKSLRQAPPSQPAALRLERSAMVHEFHHLQGLGEIEVHDDPPDRAAARFPLIYLPDGVEWQDGLEAEAEVSVRAVERVIEIPVPEHYLGKSKALLPLTAMVAMVMRHWVHIIRVNLAAQAVEAMAPSKWRQAARLVWAAIRAFPPTKARVMRRLSRIGKGCNIHPSAVVEASVIEDGAVIGPNAVVVCSRVGKKSWVQGLAQVNLSILGERSFVSSGTMLNSCVLYPQAAASQRLMQLSVLGRRCITTGGAFLMDMRFDEDIRVPLDGELQSLGSRFLGSAIGHDVRLGTGFWVAPGRAIPNGVTLVRHPDDVIRAMPKEIPADTAVFVSDNGRAVPYRPRAGR